MTIPMLHMPPKRRTYLACLITGAALLAGCAQLNPAKPAVSEAAPAQKPAAVPEKVAVVPARSAGQLALDDGIALYNNGDYNGAIKYLTNTNEIWVADKAIQEEALKYIAFSYCVTGRSALCKQQFEKALKLNPSFDLAAGEKGHPLWGPVFDRVKKAK